MRFTESFPDPLVPADVDLRDFGAMLLDAQRLRDSELAIEETPEVFRASVLLWCASWLQVPAGSLPNKDKALADYSRTGSRWPKVKAAVLARWVECSDGRLYHPVVAEKAIEAKAARDAQRARTVKATAAKKAKRDGAPPHDDGPATKQPDVARDEQRDDNRDDQRDVARDDERNVHQVKVREGNRREERADGGPPTGVARASESEDEGQEPTPASPYGPIAKAMRHAGLGDAHPGDLKFRTLVDQGATVEEFVAAATEAARQRKPFAWALAAVIGKRRDAAVVQLAPAVALPVMAVKVFVPERPPTDEERAASVRGREEALAKLRGLGMRLKAVG